jgi:hypothetical protein
MALRARGLGCHCDPGHGSGAPGSTGQAPPHRTHTTRWETTGRHYACIMAAEASLPYHEPGIVVILVLTSFLLLLNVLNAALDRLLYCGLLGQVLVGIAWGSPGAKWLSASVEETVVQLGYLGLILLVYEGMPTHRHDRLRGAERATLHLANDD